MHCIRDNDGLTHAKRLAMYCIFYLYSWQNVCENRRTTERKRMTKKIVLFDIHLHKGYAECLTATHEIVKCWRAHTRKLATVRSLQDDVVSKCIQFLLWHQIYYTVFLLIYAHISFVSPPLPSPSAILQTLLLRIHFNPLPHTTLSSFVFCSTPFDFLYKISWNSAMCALPFICMLCVCVCVAGTHILCLMKHLHICIFPMTKREKVCLHFIRHDSVHIQPEIFSYSVT